MTTTVEAMWGSRILADGGTGLPGGYLLNNQLTDFSLAPADAAGRPIANRVQPGKRPRSSMTPTLVFDRGDGRLLLSAGSAGGALIIHYTAKAVIASLDWGLDAQQAVALPNFGSLNGPTLLERGRFPASTIEALQRPRPRGAGDRHDQRLAGDSAHAGWLVRRRRSAARGRRARRLIRRAGARDSGFTMAPGRGVAGGMRAREDAHVE